MLSRQPNRNNGKHISNNNVRQATYPPNTLDTTFAYNGLGNRLTQTVGGQATTYTLDLAAGLPQVLHDDTHTYLYGNMRLAQQDSTSTEYFLTDALGSVRQMVDETGELMLSQAYQPYGEPMNSYGDGASPYGFAGEYTDRQTELQYLRARYYAPGVGRFLTKDAWAGDVLRPMSFNGWVYVYENPVNWVDPSGLAACSINFRYCIITSGPYNGFFIDTHHWEASKNMSKNIFETLKGLVGFTIVGGKGWGEFEVRETLADFAPYPRTYYTNISIGTSDSVLEGITLGILMDYNLGLEGFEGLDPACWGTQDGIINIVDHRCSAFSNEDLPSAYLGFVAYKNNWNLKTIAEKLVDNVEQNTEGTNTFPAAIGERFFEARNYGFTPKVYDPCTGEFFIKAWPSQLVYQPIGPGTYWGRSLDEILPKIPTPPQNPPPTPSP